jgi:hypothetical protein
MLGIKMLAPSYASDSIISDADVGGSGSTRAVMGDFGFINL